jgi:heme-degrading monooxygenase HmoA
LHSAIDHALENGGMSHVARFVYDVAPERRAEFEAAYGPDGQWAELFRAGDGYLGTTLERIGGAEYLVVDRWRSRADYERFLERHAARYEAMSRAHERLYVSERRLT